MDAVIDRLIERLMERMPSPVAARKEPIRFHQPSRRAKTPALVPAEMPPSLAAPPRKEPSSTTMHWGLKVLPHADLYGAALIQICIENKRWDPIALLRDGGADCPDVDMAEFIIGWFDGAAIALEVPIKVLWEELKVRGKKTKAGMVDLAVAQATREAASIRRGRKKQ